ncbi:MAG: hypothetical protein LRS43_03615 [Desulfurococcales archaeon]|nr:hypothetical protein [Desulfurococcales archaeon]
MALILELLVAAASSAIVSLVVSYVVSRSMGRSLLRVIGLAGDHVAARLARKRLARKRRRYIVFEAAGDHASMEGIDREIRSQIRRLLGIKGLSDMGYKLVYFDSKTGRGIIRVYSEYKLHLLGVLGLIRRIGDGSVRLYPIATTGSLKKASSYLRRA